MGSSKFRSRYVPFERAGIVFTDRSRTMQSSKDECDINVIMRRFEKTGVLPEMIRANPSYGDFSDPVDYQEACNIVIHAGEQFSSLSARVRERFGNDPLNFLRFATDPSNMEEMVKLGLATPRATQPVGEAKPPEAKASGGTQPKGGRSEQ